MSITGCLMLALLAQAEGAAHHGRVEGDRIVWSTVVWGQLDRGQRLELVAPLPAGTALAGDLEALTLAFTTDGRVEALVPLARGGRVVLTLVAPRGVTDLPAPLLRGVAPQRVSLESRALRFEPDPALGLAPHVGYRAVATIDRRARARLDAQVEHELPDPGATALYVDGTRLLRGTWVTPGVPWAVALAVGGVFAGVVAALLAAHRGLARRAEAERAEAILTEELRGLRDHP
jgi:hypothetical protein